MNRKIKFRGKRVDNNEWVYGYYYKIQDKHFILDKFYEDEGYNMLNIIIEVKPETVGQLHETLTRVAGKEVYEGDNITFSLMEGLGEPEKHNCTGTVNMYMTWAYHLNIEITGNIHTS